VLDIGSGTGYLLHRLSELGARDPKGVELVPERVEEARRRYPGLDVSCASATELAFSDASFDVVTQFTCLSSILDVGTRHVIARETLRVLRPGGVVRSYDLRPSPRPLRGPRRLFGGPLDPRTPIAPLGPADLRGLWGEPERLRAVQLNLDVARAVKGRRALVAVLRAMPPLRSHLLATFRKPPR
jgi:SAM-dependent methyltransferase